MSTVDEHMTKIVAALSDDDLRRELQRMEHAAVLSVRTRRQLALRTLTCLQRELDRRALSDGIAWSTTPDTEPRATEFARPISG